MNALALLVLIATYTCTVVYRAWIATRIPKFCQFVRGCPYKHKVVFIQPPNKPFRAVLKHVLE